MAKFISSVDMVADTRQATTATTKKKKKKKKTAQRNCVYNI